MSSKNNVEAIYGLSPIQKGMLYTSMMSPHSGTYTSQQVFELRGDPNFDILRKAWSEVVAHHGIFRTMFMRLDTKKPIQIMRKTVSLPWHEEDLTGLPASEREAACRQYIEADRVKGFTLNKAPLMRLAMIKMGHDFYRFVWTRHHAITDGWTTAVVMRDFLSIFNGLREGRPATLSPPRPYLDYIRWLDKQDMSQAKAFWQDYLQDMTGPTPLGIDVIPANDDSRQRERGLVFSKEETRLIVATARNAGVTLNIMAHAVWAFQLSRYSGERKVLFGSTGSGRPGELTGVEEMVGPFINTLPVVVKREDHLSVTQWLIKLHGDQAARIRYDFTPLVEIQRYSEISSDLALFESLIVFENYPFDQSMINRMKGVDLSLYESFSPNDLPLTLRVMMKGDALNLEVIYEIRRFPEANIQVLLDQFHSILMGMVADPGRSVASLGTLTDEEYNTLITDWHPTPMPYETDLLIHQIVARHARENPETPAIVFGEEVLTYGELDRRARDCARFLASRGLGSESLVGLCAYRSPHMFVCLLGILHAGGAYVPMAPDFPTDRIMEIAADAGISLFLGEHEVVDRIAREGLESHEIHTDWAVVANGCGPVPPSVTNSDQLAYVIFTSGSTGKPKGVGISHRALHNYALGVSSLMKLPAEASLTALATPAADLANTAVYGALVVGKTLRILGEKLSLDPEGLARELAGQPVSCMKLVPVHLATLLSVSAPERLLPRDCLVLGGEALDGTLVARIRELAPTCRVINHYGPTEATIGALTFQASALKDLAPGGIPIGKPLPNYRAYVTDRIMNPVATLVSGELLLGGDSLARGYLGSPAMTAEKFVPDPFSSKPGARLYHTNDKVIRRPDGAILFKGRLDHQIKIRGFRIEPGEIETVLNQCDQVKTSMVIPRGEGVDKRLVAYVIPETDTKPTPETLANVLAQQLPQYMIPAHFLLLEALPLTPNGKVDRLALSRMALVETETQEDAHGGPRDEVEAFLADVWKDVLELERVDISDNFFAIGGHSLLATLVVVRTREYFDLDLGIRDLIRNPTIADFATSIKEMQGKNVLQIPPIIPVARDSGLPLSFSQQRLWFLEQLEPGKANYNVSGALNLVGALQTQALRASLEKVVERHEILRTRFVDQEGVAVQEIADHCVLPLHCIDLSQEEIPGLIGREGSRGFDLTHPPLWRVVLARITPEHHVLVLNMHHIISDRWSVEVLVKELVTHYQIELGHLVPPVPELSIQYGDFAHWQRDYLSGEVLAQQVGYWKSKLEDSPPRLDLPTDYPHPPVQEFAGAEVKFQIPKTLTDKLHDLAQEGNATLFMTLVAALNILLYRYSAQDDILLGSPIANRTRSELEHLIGFFVNTLVLRTQLNPRMSFKELLQQVREMAVEAYAHQDVPFELVVDAVQPERNLTHSPLFQVMLVFQNTVMSILEAPDLDIEPLNQPGSVAKFDLTFILEETKDGLRGAIQYSTALYEAATIKHLAGHFLNLLGALADGDSGNLESLNLMAIEERQLLLENWSNEGQVPESGPMVHLQIDAIAAQRGGDVAVVCGDQSMTYAGLVARANQAAHAMIQQGIEPETRVGLCLERSIEMVVGMLAILKAGGVYVPLDSAYPADRLAYMIEDAGLSLVVTTQPPHEVLTQRQIPLLFLGDNNEQDPTDAPIVDMSPENAAYVIYTSGSTGQPKGVMISHANLAASTNARTSYYGDLGRCFLLLSSYAFDSSNAGIFGTLCSGGKLVIGDPQQDPSLMMALIQKWKVTQTLCLPSLYGALLDLVKPGEWPLRSVIVAGEACLPDLLEKHRMLAPDCELFNEYGPTEGTVWCTVYQWDGRIPAGSVPIGLPVPGSLIYICTSVGRLALVGVAGELCLAGLGLARGYHGNPGLTADKFRPNPFGNPGDRLYRTGDKARFRHDGQLAFGGRIDNQIKIRGFRVELGEIESVIGTHPQVDENAVVVQAGSGGRRLVGYFTGGEAPEPGQLAQYLGKRLPAYMVPTPLICLEVLPRTANGKIDRKSLAARALVPNNATDTPEGPRNEIEGELIRIWREVLKIASVGIHDNFFQLGGDSILSIQVIARANRLGYGLTPKLLFEHQTIASLALNVGATSLVVDQGPVTGPVALLPIQKWFFELDLVDSHHWNQAVLVELDETFDLEILKQALTVLLHHHDALRVRFTFDGGLPRQIFAPLCEAPDVERIDLSHLEGANLDQAFSQELDSVQASIDLKTVAPVKMAFFDLGSRGRRLLFAVHHLVVDGVSWRILLEDLGTAYGSLRSGRPAQLPPKTHSIADWAARLQSHVATIAQQELSFWLSYADVKNPPLPMDSMGANIMAHVQTHTVVMDAQKTRALLHDVPRAYQTEINDVLLYALSESMTAWTGQKSQLVSLEGHGREPLFEDIDLSRTVGWFTSEYPVLLTSEESGQTGKGLKSIKEQIRRIPRHGIGYGMLRYLSEDPEIGEALTRLAKPQLSFNYLGRFSGTEQPRLFIPAKESAGATRGEQQQRQYLLVVTGLVDDDGCLRIHWAYNTRIHHEETIQRLGDDYAKTLTRVIDHCCRPGVGGFTPSDFPGTGLGQERLDDLVAEVCQPDDHNNLEAIYPLTAQQHGMVFHSLIEQESDVYLWQLACELRGLDVTSFKKAWSKIISRHDAFRTFFLDYRSETPLQVLLRRVDMPWQELDWRGHDEAVREVMFQDLLTSRNIRRFDFGKAPVLHLVLVRWAEDKYRFIWSQHHALSDGWSQPIVLRDLFQAYEATLDGRGWHPPTPHPYREYVQWLSKQDETRAAEFWRGYLRGVSQASGLQLPQPGGEVGIAELVIRTQIPEQHTTALNMLIRSEKLTVNAVIQGLWSILLGRYGGRKDVLYGTVSSGRPGELIGVEDMVGLFVNALPVVARIDDNARALPWLAAFLAEQVQREHAGFLPLAQIQQYSNVPRGKPLFDLLVQTQNYPVGDLLEATGLDIRILNAFEKNSYSFTLKIIPGKILALEITYDPAVYTAQAVAGILAHLQCLLVDLVSNPGKTIAELNMQTEEERREDELKRETLKTHRKRSLRDIKRRPV